MSYSRTLLRKLDLDLIERLESGGRPVKRSKPPTRREPRDASEYRGARRNEQRGMVWKNSFSPRKALMIYLDGTFKGPILPNRKVRA